jgi:hypothetical protein
MATCCGSKLVVCGTHLRLSNIETFGSSMMKTDASRDGDFTVVSEFQPWSHAQFKTFLGNCLSHRKLVKQFVLPETYFPGAPRQLECFCDVLCSWNVSTARPRFCTLFVELLNNTEFLGLAPKDRAAAYEAAWIDSDDSVLRFGLRRGQCIASFLKLVASLNVPPGIGKEIIAEALEASVRKAAVQSMHLDTYIGHGLGFLPTDGSVYFVEVSVVFGMS